jgi:hypothetical protein
MGGRLPDFLGLGVQKGGTTTLQRLLEQHPDAFLPAAKELHYFSLHCAEGEAWYRDQFAPARPGQLCGEITPYYLFHPQVPSRVQTLLPEARLIVLLRDPVERVLSQYFHSVRLGLETLPIEEALAAEPWRLQDAEAALIAPEGRHRSHQEHSYLSRSRYENQLPSWQARFVSSQLLVLRSEDLFEHPQAVWDQVLRFLALDAWPLPALPSAANVGRGEAAGVPVDLRWKLREQLAGTYQWAAQSLGMEWGPR